MIKLHGTRPSFPLAPRPAGRRATLLLGLALCACGGSDRGPKLNVLLITLDTTRPDRMSCYGYDKQTTPRLDALARKSARFERAIATAGITPMSHSSILTGLNNYRHGLRVFFSESVNYQLKPSIDTLPELLGPLGWRTAAMVSAYPVSEFYGLHQGFDVFNHGLDLSERDFSTQNKHETEWFDGEKNTTQRRGDFTVSAALDWLDTLEPDDPFCMWVHMFDAHDFSIVPPQDFARQYGVEYDTSVKGQDLGWRDKMYDPELAFMDQQIGRLLDWLETSGRADDTIVVVTADHGQGLKDGFLYHRWFKHRLLYDWSIRVPLLVYIPELTSGQVVREQVRTVDILPTLLDVLGLPAADLDGESLLGLIRGEKEDSPRLAYADALNLDDAHAPSARQLPPNCDDNLYCVTDGRWKLIWHERNVPQGELFDLDADPHEQNNLFHQQIEHVERLKAFLDENAAMEKEAPISDARSIDSGALEALGYGGDDEDGE